MVREDLFRVPAQSILAAAKLITSDIALQFNYSLVGDSRDYRHAGRTNECRRPRTIDYWRTRAAHLVNSFFAWINARVALQFAKVRHTKLSLGI